MMSKAAADKPVLPKRFYQDVSIQQAQGRYIVQLDGRAAKTPAKNVFQLKQKDLADACVAEWVTQEEFIDMHKMPLSRHAMTVIDRAAEDAAVWQDTVLKYLNTDCLCYRAEEPDTLVVEEEKIWGPYLGWAASLGIQLNRVEGLMAADQPAESMQACAVLLEAATTSELYALRIATELSGSAILALALWKGFQPAEDVFAASRVDETYQTEKWGIDAEAQAREKSLQADFMAVATFLKLVQ